MFSSKKPSIPWTQIIDRKQRVLFGVIITAGLLEIFPRI
jgi:hypothetical protein